MSSWHQGKLFIEHVISISHDSLHVIAGVLVWFAIGLVTRPALTGWMPWMWTFAFIFWNETVDRWMERWPDPGMQFGEGAKDLALTMLLPTIMMFAARVRPDLFRPTARKRK